MYTYDEELRRILKTLEDLSTALKHAEMEIGASYMILRGLQSEENAKKQRED